MALLKKTGLFCILFLLFFGCRKTTDANWDVDAVIPVVNSLLNIKNFVNDSLFQADNTGLLHVSLNRQIASLKLDSLIALPDTSAPKVPINNPFPGDFILNPGTPLTLQPADLKFDIPNGVALKRVDVRQGFLTVKFINNLTEPIDLIYQITGATKNGNPFTVKETIPSGTDTLVKAYDLSGYSLNLRGNSGLVYNTIVQTYTFGLSATASQSITLSGYQSAALLAVSYSKIVPAYAEGYFGQQTINVAQDTVKLGLTDHFRASNFMLSDATMDFTILNEFGAEFSSTLSNNKSINTPNNNSVTLQTNQLSNININRATKAGSTVFPSVKVLSFTKANSNITTFISNLPDKLTYKGNIFVNPLGNISGYNDFAFYNTGIRIMANIDIPLRFTADYFELQSNTPVDFSNVAQLEKVNYGNFAITATNGFPFAVKLQGYMYDAQNVMIDSLFVPGSNVIDGGVLNYNNEVVAPVQKKITVPINKTKIEHLRQCKIIRVVSRVIMPKNPPEIKILESYEVKVIIVANMNYNVSLGG